MEAILSMVSKNYSSTGGSLSSLDKVIGLRAVVLVLGPAFLLLVPLSLESSWKGQDSSRSSSAE